MAHLLAAVTAANADSESPIGDALVGMVFILVGGLTATVRVVLLVAAAIS